MSSHEIEDVLASIRRLVSDDLRPANRPHPIGKLMLTPALRVVSPVGVIDDGTAPLDRAPDPAGATPRDDWVPDQTTLSAVADQDADHLDFASSGATAASARAPIARSAWQSAAEAFHAQTDEFILSYSDTGTIMLRGDAPASAPPTDHGAVFAVLHTAGGPVTVPPVEALVDAEGGAPVEDEAAWSTVEWDDAPVTPESAFDQAAPDAAPQRGEVMQDDGAKDGPLILSFVSARRSPGSTSADVLTLRGPLVQVMDANEGRASESTSPEPTVLQRTRPEVKAKHLAAQSAAGQAGADTAKTDDVATDAADLAAASSFVEQNMTASTAAEAALETILHSTTEPASGTASAAGNADAAAFVVGAEAPQATAMADTVRMVDVGRAKAVLADAASVADAQETAIAAEMASGPWSDSLGDNMANGAQDGPIGSESLAALESGTFNQTEAPTQIGPEQGAEGDNGAAMPGMARASNSADPMAKPLHLSASRTKAPSKLAEAAFTRWPGWAQPDPGQIATAALVVPEPPATPVPPAAETRRKPKAAVQDLGWADRAEAEIHRQLAAELGSAVVGEVNAPAPGLQLSEAALRDLVRDMIREELTGKLGERITQNVRKLVQMELQKSMSLHVAEFRSQRRDPG